MMIGRHRDELAYLRDRVANERERAKTSGNRAVRRIHAEMAALYEARIARTALHDPAQQTTDSASPVAQIP